MIPLFGRVFNRAGANDVETGEKELAVVQVSMRLEVMNIPMTDESA